MYLYHLFNPCFSAILGNQTIGAVAIIVTQHNNFPNEIIRNNSGKIITINFIGRGGRTIVEQPDGEKKYNFTENQQLAKNYPLIFSCENNLPVRVILQREYTAEEKTPQTIMSKQQESRTVKGNKNIEVEGAEVETEEETEVEVEVVDNPQLLYEYLGLFKISNFKYILAGKYLRYVFQLDKL